MKPNFVCVIQGRSESGKTTLLRTMIGAKLAEGRIVIVHDPDRQFEFLHHYADAEEAREALLAAKGKVHTAAIGIASIDEEPVTALAVDLAASQARPVFVVYDEAVLVEGASPHHISPRLRTLLARRRHMNVELVILCQDLGQLHALWQRQANIVILFACNDIDRLKIIAKRMDIPFADLHAVSQALAEFFEAVELRPGRIV